MTRAKLLMTIVWIWKDLRCQRRILWSLLTVRCDDWGRWRWQEGKKRPVVAFRKRHLFNGIGWLSWFGETLLVCGWNNSIQLSLTFPLPLFAQTSTPDTQKQIKLILHKKKYFFFNRVFAYDFDSHTSSLRPMAGWVWLFAGATLGEGFPRRARITRLASHSRSRGINAQ